MDIHIHRPSSRPRALTRASRAVVTSLTSEVVPSWRAPFTSDAPPEARVAWPPVAHGRVLRGGPGLFASSSSAAGSNTGTRSGTHRAGLRTVAASPASERFPHHAESAMRRSHIVPARNDYMLKAPCVRTAFAAAIAAARSERDWARSANPSVAPVGFRRELGSQMKRCMVRSYLCLGLVTQRN